MKKPIVGIKENEDRVAWFLPNDINLVSKDDGMITVRFGDELAGVLTKSACHELFQVILYPPGSVPSPESADPTDKHRMKEEKERQWDIPRADILDNGDWN